MRVGPLRIRYELCLCKIMRFRFLVMSITKQFQVSTRPIISYFSLNRNQATVTVITDKQTTTVYQTA